MNESRKDKKSSIVKQDDPFLSVIKTDANLSRLPLFALTRQGLKTEVVREWVFTGTRGNEHVELIWRIMATPQYGYPSPFAKKVHRAVEYLLTQNRFPAPEYLDFSLYEITKILDLDDSGRTLDKIRDALNSIASTTLQSQGTYYYLENGAKKSINKVFRLYDSIILIGEKLPDGTTVADRNYIYFNQFYLQTLNSGYIKPLDFPYWNSLRSDIARRLYEYLSFVSFATKCRSFSIKYHRLCELLPITPQRYLSSAKRNLSKAHQELMNTGFLNKVVWRESKTDPKKWIIEYHFGVRAKLELQRGFNDATYRPAILAVETAEISEIEELIESEDENQEKWTKSKKKQAQEKVLAPIAQELIERGITKAVAIDFAEHFPEEYLREKIELHDVNRATGVLTQNAAGWLREAITHDFKLSEEQEQKLERLQKIKAEEKVKAKLEEKAKQIQEQRLKEALANFPSEEDWVSARVEAHIKVREEMRKFDPTRPSFTEEEIEKYRQDYKEKFPQTDDERRNWLITNENKYNLRKIISELSEQGLVVANGQKPTILI